MYKKNESVKDDYFQIRVTSQFKTAIGKMAARHNMSMSEYASKAIDNEISRELGLTNVESNYD